MDRQNHPTYQTHQPDQTSRTTVLCNRWANGQANRGNDVRLTSEDLYADADPPITPEQFVLLADPRQLTRKIAAVHVHHTWRPRRQDFRGLATIEAMRKFHMEQNHWSDIAQQLTIDPQGGLWTGRNWNVAPASATGQTAPRPKGRS